MAEGGEEDLPRDAKIVKTLLKSMGVDDYEPRSCINFWNYDAQVYSEHAGKASIDSDDIKLSIQTKVNFSFSQPPPREKFMTFSMVIRVLLELARNRNKIPLPKSIAGPGIPLPPDQDTLINPNYQLAIAKKQISQPEETEEDEESTDIPNSSPKPKSKSLSRKDRRTSRYSSASILSPWH
ncbi:Transcription initiation factor TFIID subunit 9 [Datura stramonium]|uniref:Transcription initiation factor TFIID subunit 9 n=1 Tax=Datura stramonium TaxID=4076 RepID=A0ABS8SXH4_DATST|nr:Transcription initiation factor TFIID subunit 9 [Datura stramonium]